MTGSLTMPVNLAVTVIPPQSKQKLQTYKLITKQLDCKLHSKNHVKQLL